MDTLINSLLAGEPKALARSISLVENDDARAADILAAVYPRGREIPVCSVKSSIGHTMGAAGILESIAAVNTIREVNRGGKGVRLVTLAEGDKLMSIARIVMPTPVALRGGDEASARAATGRSANSVIRYVFAQTTMPENRMVKPTFQIRSG